MAKNRVILIMEDFLCVFILINSMWSSSKRMNKFMFKYCKGDV